MICKTLITFDSHSQRGGVSEVRFLGEELLAETDPLQVTNSVFFRLPFRLRIGPIADFKIGGKVPGHVTVLNSIGSISDAAQKELNIRAQAAKPEFASDVCITLAPIKIPEDKKLKIKEIINGTDYAAASQSLHFLKIHPEETLKPLNALIVLYRVLCGQEIQFNRVRRVLRKDFFGRQTYELHAFSRLYEPTDFSRVCMALEDAKPMPAEPFQIGGFLKDISTETVIKLQNQLSNGTQYAYYLFALQAQDYIHQTDYLNALLYSVIALENAHSELIEHVAETKASSAKSRKWAQELIRNAGISAMIRLTPFLFMEQENRPADDIISGVVRAIEIRNELAHAKRDSNRNLKIDGHISDVLLPLVENVFCYINAIARHLPD